MKISADGTSKIDPANNVNAESERVIQHTEESTFKIIRMFPLSSDNAKAKAEKITVVASIDAKTTVSDSAIKNNMCIE